MARPHRSTTPGAALSDRFRRLDRPVIGGNLHGLPEMVLRLHARTERAVHEPPFERWEPRQFIETSTRSPRRLARTEPNAPQLIRVVKTPYALSPGWARRKQVREARERLERYVREDALTIVREATDRPPFSSPALLRPRGSYPLVPRGLAARYASGCLGDGEAE